VPKDIPPSTSAQTFPLAGGFIREAERLRSELQKEYMKLSDKIESANRRWREVNQHQTDYQLGLRIRSTKNLEEDRRILTYLTKVEYFAEDISKSETEVRIKQLDGSVESQLTSNSQVTEKAQKIVLRHLQQPHQSDTGQTHRSNY
jgi:hypothetical protein